MSSIPVGTFKTVGAAGSAGFAGSSVFAGSDPPQDVRRASSDPNARIRARFIGFPPESWARPFVLSHVCTKERKKSPAHVFLTKTSENLQWNVGIGGHTIPLLGLRSSRN